MLAQQDGDIETTLDLTRLTPLQSIRFNQVAADIRIAYNDAIAGLARAYPKDLAWQLSSLTSRHSNLSFTFLRCCQLALVQDYLMRGVRIGHVVTDSRAMQQVLVKYLGTKGAGVRVIVKRSLQAWLIQRLRPWKYLLSVMLHTFAQGLCARVTRPRPSPERPPLTLLDCFVLPGSFSDGVVYQDRYYPGVLDYLRDPEKERTFYLPTFVGVGLLAYGGLYRKIRRPENRFLLREDYLCLKDYVSAFGAMGRVSALTRALPSGKHQFLGFDLAPLLLEEIAQTRTNGSSFLAFLNYRLAQRLSERRVSVRLVVDWNENQVIDKGFVKGFHDFHPGTPVIGYRGFIVDPGFHIYLHPTRAEIEAGFIPDELRVIGEGLVPRIKEFAPELTVKSAPAFRFSELWGERSTSGVSQNSYVLVALPIHRESMQGILSLIDRALENPALQKIDLALKPHPIYDEKQVRRMFPGPWRKNLFFVSGDFNECLDRATVLIGNYSSTCVEALARGIPTVVVGGQSGFTHNPVPPEIPKSIWALCYQADELTDAVTRFFHRSPEEIESYRRLGESIRERYFTKVDRDSVREFLRLPQDRGSTGVSPSI